MVTNITKILQYQGREMKNILLALFLLTANISVFSENNSNPIMDGEPSWIPDFDYLWSGSIPDADIESTFDADQGSNVINLLAEGEDRFFTFRPPYSTAGVDRVSFDAKTSSKVKRIEIKIETSDGNWYRFLFKTKYRLRTKGHRIYVPLNAFVINQWGHHEYHFLDILRKLSGNYTLEVEKVQRIVFKTQDLSLDNIRFYDSNNDTTLDTDNDGIPDITDSDDDNDGFSDTEEIAAGTDPLNADSKPQDSGNNTNLLAYWKLDESTSSSALDASGNGHEGTVNGAASWVAGMHSGALSVDGATDISISIDSRLQPESLTLSAWIKVTPGLNDWGWIAGEGDNYGLFVDRRYEQNSLIFYYYNGTTWVNISAPLTSLRDSQWHHVAASFDRASGMSKLYVDAQRVSRGRARGSSIVYSRGEGFRIGSMDGSRHFKGIIDDVRLYSKALSSAAIATLSIDGSTGGGNGEKVDQTITLEGLPDEHILWPEGDAKNWFYITASASSGLPITVTTEGCHLNSTTKIIYYADKFVVKSPTTCTITVTQEGNDSFNPAPELSKTLVVNKYLNFPITFDIDGPTPKKAGSAYDIRAFGDPSLGFEHIWIDDFKSRTPTICSADGNTVYYLAAGDCTIRASINNERLEGSATVTLAVVKQEQTISFNPPVSKTIGDAPFRIGASSTSKLLVDFRSQSPGICSVTGNTVAILTTGNCIITAIQQGNRAYHPAENVSRTIVITETKIELIASIDTFDPDGIEIADNRIFVTDDDSVNVKVFNLDTLEFITSFGKQEINSPNGLGIYGNRIFVTYIGRTDEIEVYDLDTYAHLATISGGHLANPNDLEFANNKLFVTDGLTPDQGGSIKIFDLSTFDYIASFGTNDLTDPRGIVIHNDEIHVTDEDSVKIFDLNTLDLLEEYGPVANSEGIFLANNKIFVASIDYQTIKVFDFKTKEFITSFATIDPQRDGIAVFQNRIFVSDRNDHRIEIFNNPFY